MYTQEIHAFQSLRGSSVRSAERLVSRLTRLWATLELWHQRARQRQQLLTLSDHMLSDIGISRADAEQEAEKPFWRG